MGDNNNDYDNDNKTTTYTTSRDDESVAKAIRRLKIFTTHPELSYLV